MALGYDKKLYILAFDHRGSFEKMFGISGRAPTPEEAARVSDAKSLIFEGFAKAVGEFEVGIGSGGKSLGPIRVESATGAAGLQLPAQLAVLQAVAASSGAVGRIAVATRSRGRA